MTVFDRIKRVLTGCGVRTRRRDGAVAAGRSGSVIPPGHRCSLRIVRTCSDVPMRRYNASCRVDAGHFNEWGASPGWLELVAVRRGLR